MIETVVKIKIAKVNKKLGTKDEKASYVLVRAPYSLICDAQQM